MRSPNSRNLIWIIVGVLLAPSLARAQVIQVTNSPRTFTVLSPATWTRGPAVTGNTRISLVSPRGTPRGECAVIAIEFKGTSMSQSEINQNMATLASQSETEAELARSYNNVKVRSVGRGLLAGFPSHVANFEYSVGTPTGEIWGVMTTSTAAVAPNISWTVGCGGLGKSIDEARKSYSHWQVELNNFPTSFKLR